MIRKYAICRTKSVAHWIVKYLRITLMVSDNVDEIIEKMHGVMNGTRIVGVLSMDRVAALGMEFAVTIEYGPLGFSFSVLVTICISWV